MQSISIGTLGYLPAWTENRAHRLKQPAHLRVAVCRLPDCLAVEPQRDGIQEQAAAHLPQVDSTLDPVGQRIERAGRIVWIQTKIVREAPDQSGLLKRQEERAAARQGMPQ